MVDLAAERLITEAHNALEDLASHFRKVTVVPAQPSFDGHIYSSSSESASPVGQIDWGILVRTVGWKASRAGFSASVELYRDELASARSGDLEELRGEVPT